MARARWNHPIRHRTATPVSVFPFVEAGSRLRPIHITVSKSNVTVTEIGNPWSLPGIKCYGLLLAMKVPVHPELPDLIGDSICQAMIAKLSHDFAELCGVRSKMLPTLAIKEAQSAEAHIYSVLFALPIYPSLNEMKFVLGQFPSAKTIVGNVDFGQELRFMYARADLLDDRAEAVV